MTTRETWITDWENLSYIFNEMGWTRSNINQVHIGRQDDSWRTLCGIDSRGWGAANPEPDNPNPDAFYGSCLRCKKIFNRLRAQVVVGE